MNDVGKPTRARPKRFGPELYDRTTAPLSLNVRMLKTEGYMRPCCTGV